MKGLKAVTMVGVLTVIAVGPAIAQQPNPCAAKKPTGRTVQNPCASKNPIAKNPGMAQARPGALGAATAVAGPSAGDALFGAGPTLRPLQAR